MRLPLLLGKKWMAFFVKAFWHTRIEVDRIQALAGGLQNGARTCPVEPLFGRASDRWRRVGHVGRDESFAEERGSVVVGG